MHRSNKFYILRLNICIRLMILTYSRISIMLDLSERNFPIIGTLWVQMTDKSEWRVCKNIKTIYNSWTVITLVSSSWVFSSTRPWLVWFFEQLIFKTFCFVECAWSPKNTCLTVKLGNARGFFKNVMVWFVHNYA